MRRSPRISIAPVRTVAVVLIGIALAAMAQTPQRGAPVSPRAVWSSEVKELTGVSEQQFARSGLGKLTPGQLTSLLDGIVQKRLELLAWTQKGQEKAQERSGGRDENEPFPVYGGNGTELLQVCQTFIKFEDTGFKTPGGKANEDVAESVGCTRYLAGILDAEQDLHALIDVNLMKNTGAVLSCVPSDVKVNQVARVVVKWLNDHPANLHNPASISAQVALAEAFPCK